MDGSVDKNTQLRSALLYFVDEALGYRHSIHFLHRWLETDNRSELEGLVLEIGRERFVDLQPLLDTVNDPLNLAGIQKLHEYIQIRGLYTPYYDNTWPVKIPPMPYLDDSNLEHIEGNAWSRHNWLEENTHNGMSPYYVTAMAYKLLKESNQDVMKLFDLLELMFGLDETLFSCVKNQDIPLLGRQLAQYYPEQAQYITTLSLLIHDQQSLNWVDALSRNQVRSKLWLIDKLRELKLFPKKRRVTDPTAHVLLVGGWVGMLPFLADMKGNYLDTVVNIDIDTSVHGASDQLNRFTESDFKVSSKDIRTLDITKYSKPLVIDTIVEHFENHGDWVKTLPPGTTVVLQGNDMFNVPDHVNCHKSLEEFLESCGLNSIIWAGELNLFKCTRFMAIGNV